MNIGRRGFLKSLTATLAALSLPTQFVKGTTFVPLTRELQDWETKPFNRELFGKKLLEKYYESTVLTRDNILRKITDIGKVLDEQNVPSSPRYLIAPQWLQTECLKTGEMKIGRINNFDIYQSDLVPDDTAYILPHIF